jgi:hypothetical protein
MIIKYDIDGIIRSVLNDRAVSNAESCASDQLISRSTRNYNCSLHVATYKTLALFTRSKSIPLPLMPCHSLARSGSLCSCSMISRLEAGSWYAMLPKQHDIISLVTRTVHQLGKSNPGQSIEYVLRVHITEDVAFEESTGPWTENMKCIDGRRSKVDSTRV